MKGVILWPRVDPRKARIETSDFLQRLAYTPVVVATKLYIDMSVWNARFDVHVPEIMSHTEYFFELLKLDSAVAAHLSEIVEQELGNAPQERKPRLAALIGEVRPIRLRLNEASASLADEYVKHGILRAGHIADARHVAIATVSGIDVLVSWNYRHLVNRRRREAFNGVNAILGYRSLEIVSPPEVFYD